MRESRSKTRILLQFLTIVYFSIGFIKTDNFQIWQSFFWICGAMTITYGLVVGIFLPDNPVKAKFINQREKAIAIDRVRVNQTGALSSLFHILE